LQLLIKIVVEWIIAEKDMGNNLIERVTMAQVCKYATFGLENNGKAQVMLR
jgi:hypothetical protein